VPENLPDNFGVNGIANSRTQPRNCNSVLPLAGRIATLETLEGVVESKPPLLRGHRASVLVIDDDQGTRETFGIALTAHGHAVMTAGSGAEALQLVRLCGFDLVLIDLRLPDILGTELAKALHHKLPRAQLILVSGFLTTRITVEAVRTGVVDVIEKPVAIEDLLAAVDSILRDAGGPQVCQPVPSAEPMAASAAAVSRRRSRSAAERWAVNVLKACASHADIRTLDDWAACVGLSHSSLCESCRLLRIRPHDARDLARVLRALIASGGRSDLGVLLDVSDVRTLKNLFNRAGLNYGSDAGAVPVEQFLRCQHFVKTDNEGLSELRKLLASRFTHI
jgi:DNA-binding response OmpR family regulator